MVCLTEAFALRPLYGDGIESARIDKPITISALNRRATRLKEDREFWEKNWKSDATKNPDDPDAPTWRNETDERIMTFIRPYLPASGVVAEIGCGSGRLLARIGRERPVKLVAMDYAPAALELVKESARIFGVE